MRITIQSSNSTIEYISKESKIIPKRHLPSMLTAGLFTKSKTGNQARCLPINEWINVIHYIYTVDYYSVIKRNKILLLSATWIKVDIII